MKFLSVVLAVVFFLSGEIIAQNGFYGQHQKFNSNSTFGVYQDELPDAFLFLIDDEFQQILVNPAKSALLEQPFAATTLADVTNFPINAGVVLPGDWVFTISYQNNNNTDLRKTDITQFETFSFVQGLDLVTENQSRRDDNKTDETNAFNTTEVRMLKTWEKSDNEARALGAFLGFSQVDMREVGVFDLLFIDEVRRTRDDSLILEVTTNIGRIRDIIEQNKLNLFQGGFEYYRVSSNGESAHKVYVQLTDFDHEESLFEVRRDTIVNRTTSSTTGRIDVHEEEDRILTDAVPLGLEYRGYFNRKLNWLGDDFIFLSLGGRYSQGDLNFNLRMLDRRTVFQNGTETFTTSTSLNFGNTGNASSLLFGEISPGYAIQVTEDDYSLFTGINPFLNYTKVEDYYFFVEASIRESLNSTLHTGARMPFFGSFDITEGLSLWGGGTVSYNHYIFKTEEEQVVKVDEEDFTLPMDYKLNDRETMNRIDRSLFAGFKFTHRSGLTLNTNIQRNLANINNWLVSVGYSF